VLDMVVANGLIIDGTGDVPYEGSVLIEHGEIRDVIAKTDLPRAHRVIDARGRWITPGFIDLHGHNDLDVIESPLCEDKICQGVTTQSVGHCGVSAAPLDPRVPVGVETILLEKPEWKTFTEYLTAIDAARPATHVAAFVGYSNLRSVARIEGDAYATYEEIRRMRVALQDAMMAGAFGLTTGLTYPPQMSASTAELVELCRTVAKHDGLYATHIRHNTDMVSQGVEEVVHIAEESGTRTHIAHLQFRRSDVVEPSAIIEQIYRARMKGIRLTCDQYPYLAGLGPISPFFPAWVFDKDWVKHPHRLETRAVRDRIAGYMRDAVQPFIDWDEIFVPRSSAGSPMESVQGLARSSGKSPSDVLVDCLRTLREKSTCLVFGKREEDLEMLARCPFCAVGSDGSQRTQPIHPRTYGTFVRFLKMFTKSSPYLSAHETVYRMTGLAASILQLQSRGTLEPGKAADLLVIDPDRLDDRATYDDPAAHPKGIDYVIVEGTVVLEDGEHTMKRPGCLLRG